MNSTTLDIEPMFSLPAASLSNSFTLIGQPENPSVMLLIANLTNATIDISKDGVNTHFQLPANTSIIHDIQTNRTINQPLSFSASTAWYAKGSAAAGQVNVTSYFVR